jgi:large subunit ribosomal protein L23
MLLKPIITEHTLAEAKKGRFSFAVTKANRKPAIKRLVEETFGVEVVRVDTSVIPHKQYRSGRARLEKRTLRGKKAVVTLKGDQKIDLFEVGSDD